MLLLTALVQVFPRPRNISEAYGGGRNLKPGQVRSRRGGGLGRPQWQFSCEGTQQGSCDEQGLRARVLLEPPISASTASYKAHLCCNLPPARPWSLRRRPLLISAPTALTKRMVCCNLPRQFLRSNRPWSLRKRQPPARRASALHSRSTERRSGWMLTRLWRRTRRCVMHCGAGLCCCPTNSRPGRVLGCAARACVLRCGAGRVLGCAARACLPLRAVPLVGWK